MHLTQSQWIKRSKGRPEVFKRLLPFVNLAGRADASLGFWDGPQHRCVEPFDELGLPCFVVDGASGQH